MTLDYSEYSEHQMRLAEQQNLEDRRERFAPYEPYEDESFLDLLRRLDGEQVEPVMLVCEPEERRDWR